MSEDLLGYSARIALAEKDAEIARLIEILDDCRLKRQALGAALDAERATLTEARRLLTVALGYLEGVRAEEPFQPPWLNFAMAMMVLRDFVLTEGVNDER